MKSSRWKVLFWVLKFYDDGANGIGTKHVTTTKLQEYPNQHSNEKIWNRTGARLLDI